MEPINETQNLVFELMEKASFNEFDGTNVVDDLKANPKLWKGVVMTRDYAPLIALRDIEMDCWNVDTLYIIPATDKAAKELMEIAKMWKADDIDLINGEDAVSHLGGRFQVLLRIWWD